MKQLNEINEKLITVQKENIKLLEEIIENKDLIIQELKQQLLIQGVGSSLPSKDKILIENMCLSFRHDFGLLPELIKQDLRRDCKNWLISYENNRK